MNISTQGILFLLMVIIGLAYARKHGNKAKKAIEEYHKKKKENEEKNQD